MGQNAQRILDGMEAWVRRLRPTDTAESEAAQQLLGSLQQTRQRLESEDVQADEDR